MERLVTVRDVTERYGCSLPTARKYLRQMFHFEEPLAAPKWAFDEWEENRMVAPAGTSSKRKAEVIGRNTGRVIVPRNW